MGRFIAGGAVGTIVSLGAVVACGLLVVFGMDIGEKDGKKAGFHDGYLNGWNAYHRRMNEEKSSENEENTSRD